jgi:anti-sigma28 factor (negative regulator of flagellin synthesis)
MTKVKKSIMPTNRSTKAPKFKIKTAIKAGGFGMNHNRSAKATSKLKIKTAIKAGGFSINHNRVAL